MERVAVSLWEMQQPQETGLALDERADGGLLALTDDQITFPVSRFAAVFGSEGPLVDRQHRLFKPGPATVGALLGAAVIGRPCAPVGMLRS